MKNSWTRLRVAKWVISVRTTPFNPFFFVKQVGVLNPPTCFDPAPHNPLRRRAKGRGGGLACQVTILFFGTILSYFFNIFSIFKYFMTGQPTYLYTLFCWFFYWWRTNPSIHCGAGRVSTYKAGLVLTTHLSSLTCLFPF